MLLFVACRVLNPRLRAERVSGHALGGQCSFLVWRLPCRTWWKERLRHGRRTSWPRNFGPSKTCQARKRRQRGMSHDDFPEVRALPPPLLSEWRAQREALEGQTALWMVNISSKEKGEAHKPTLVGGFNPFKKYCSNWIISPGRGENKKKLETTTWNMICKKQIVLTGPTLVSQKKSIPPKKTHRFVAVLGGAKLAPPKRRKRRWAAGPRRRFYLAGQELSHEKSRSNIEKKRRRSNSGGQLRVDPLGSSPPELRHSLVALAGSDRGGGRARLIWKKKYSFKRHCDRMLLSPNNWIKLAFSCSVQTNRRPAQRSFQPTSNLRAKRRLD